MVALEECFLECHHDRDDGWFFDNKFKDIFRVIATVLFRFILFNLQPPEDIKAVCF